MPTCVKDIRVFIGFYNFYQRFILNFSKITGLLNALTKKNVLFSWTAKCKKTFLELKQHVCKAFFLRYFDSNEQYFMEIDFSDYVNASIFSQPDSNSIFHLVAYFLHRISLAKCNYKIYDKELLAIISPVGT